MSETTTPALHRESDTLYRQIAEIWREKIVSGEYKPGGRAPERTRYLGVSRRQPHPGPRSDEVA